MTGASYVDPIGGTGHLTAADVPVVVGALRDAVRWQEYRMTRCWRCQPGGLPCAEHGEAARAIVAYRSLGRALGDAW